MHNFGNIIMIPCHLINQLSDIYLQNHRPLTRLRYIYFPAINKLISRVLEMPVIPHPVMKFPFVLWNQKTYYQIHKTQLLAPILSEMKPIHILPFSTLESNLYIRLSTSSIFQVISFLYQISPP